MCSSHLHHVAGPGEENCFGGFRLKSEGVKPLRPTNYYFTFLCGTENEESEVRVTLPKDHCAVVAGVTGLASAGLGEAAMPVQPVLQTGRNFWKSSQYWEQERQLLSRDTLTKIGF